jgi:hypothetical protein
MQAIKKTSEDLPSCGGSSLPKSVLQGVHFSPQNGDLPNKVVKRSLWSRVSLAGIVSTLLMVWYATAFVKSLNGRWFDPAWTTDDATQQTYPLYDAIYPDLFKDDLVTEVMRGCLPPIHYWVSYAITLATKDPIMTGHWVMLLQVSLAVGFLYFAVRRFSGSSVPAALAVLWLMHSRNTMQRMTGGLPRGWTPAIFGAFLYFAATRNHWAALATILIGSMLNPPGALIVGVAYGLIMLWRWWSSHGSERERARSRVFQAVAVAPLLLVVALVVVKRPAHIGQMVSFQEAAKMPEFSRPHGRFPFLPLSPVFEEVNRFGFQAFVGRLYKPTKFWKENIWWMVPFSLLAIVAVGARKRVVAVPVELLCFGFAAATTYALSRQFAFRLFVPDRHLQIPMVFFTVTAFAVGVWRLFSVSAGKQRTLERYLKISWPALLSYAALGLVVYQCSSNGLQGEANFNYPNFRRGGFQRWLRANTGEQALIAGHPTHCDGTQLFSARRTLVTTETSHPFYPRYNLEMRRRSEVSLRAHYAETLQEVASLLEPEGVTHFVFRRADFKPERIKNLTYFPPLDKTVKQLVNRPSGVFAYNELPKELDPASFPYVKFIDEFSLVIDVRELSSYLRARGWAPPQASLSSSIRRHAASRRTLVASGSVDQAGFAS